MSYQADYSKYLFMHPVFRFLHTRVYKERFHGTYTIIELLFSYVTGLYVWYDNHKDKVTSIASKNLIEDFLEESKFKPSPLGIACDAGFESDIFDFCDIFLQRSCPISYHNRQEKARQSLKWFRDFAKTFAEDEAVSKTIFISYFADYIDGEHEDFRIDGKTFGQYIDVVMGSDTLCVDSITEKIYYTEPIDFIEVLKNRYSTSNT